jgi:hypothetical protein
LDSAAGATISAANQMVDAMPRALPFAIAIFMLMPFAIWAALWLSGMRGAGWNGLTSPEGVVLMATSLPLAGLFWVQNLRQLGDSMGQPTRLRMAERLAVLMPVAIVAIGAAGLAVLAMLERPGAAIGLVAGGVAAMAILAAAGARAEPERAPMPEASDPAQDAVAEQTALLFLLNIVLFALLGTLIFGVAFLSWTAMALVPVAFALLIAIAQGGTTAG